MEKEYQKIYIWSFIIISSVVLSLMYTPLGGNLHRSNYGVLEYRVPATVNFGSKINNAPKAYNRTAESHSSVPSINSSSEYSVLSSPVVSSSNSRSQSSGGGSYSNNQYSSHSNVVSTSVGGGSMLALASTGGGSGGSSYGGGSFSGAGGGGGLFNSSMPGSTTTMQKAGLDDDDFIADPGGDPEGNPLPVGDGLYFMIFMALIYGFYKLRVTRKQVSN